MSASSGPEYVHLRFVEKMMPNYRITQYLILVSPLFDISKVRVLTSLIKQAEWTHCDLRRLDILKTDPAIEGLSIKGYVVLTICFHPNTITRRRRTTIMRLLGSRTPLILYMLVRGLLVIMQ